MRLGGGGETVGGGQRWGLFVVGSAGRCCGSKGWAAADISGKHLNGKQNTTATKPPPPNIFLCAIWSPGGLCGPLSLCGLCIRPLPARPLAPLAELRRFAGSPVCPPAIRPHPHPSMPMPPPPPRPPPQIHPRPNRARQSSRSSLDSRRKQARALSAANSRAHQGSPRGSRRSCRPTLVPAA